MDGRLWLCVCVVFVCAPLVDTFGTSGHQIVGQLATNMLTPAGQAMVASLLLPNQTLSNVSNWPDDYDHSPSGSWSSCLHYANVLQSDRLFSFQRDCVPVGDVDTCCVVAGIMNYSSQVDAQYHGTALTSIKRYLFSRPPTAMTGEPTPISFLTHFIGDIHQPLHVGYGCDEGGNYVNVRFFGENSNLHTTWDTLIIDRYCGGDWEKFAAELQFILDNDPHLRQSFDADMNATGWAEESYNDYVRHKVYDFSVDGASSGLGGPVVYPGRLCPINGVVDLPDTYYDRNLRVLKLRLMAAGSRFARLLNDIAAS